MTVIIYILLIHKFKHILSTINNMSKKAAAEEITPEEKAKRAEEERKKQSSIMKMPIKMDTKK